MQLSNSNEEIVVRTHKHSVYLWRTENISLELTHPEMKFIKM